MAFVDYEYYCENYNGDASETAFNKAIGKATATMLQLTFDHIVEQNGEAGQIIGGQFVAINAEELDALKMGLCSLVDSVISMDTARAQANTGGNGSIKAVSSGGESITYGETRYTQALSDKAAEYGLYKDALTLYMRPEIFTVNPFFAGVR